MPLRSLAMRPVAAGLQISRHAGTPYATPLSPTALKVAPVWLRQQPKRPKQSRQAAAGVHILCVSASPARFSLLIRVLCVLSASTARETTVSVVLHSLRDVVVLTPSPRREMKHPC